MAKKYRALSNIEHGEEVEDGNQITRFPHGSIVEGLDKDTMKSLWDAGVLEEVEDVPAPTVTKSVTQTPSGNATGNTPPSTSTSGGTTGDGGTPPAAPVNTTGSPKPQGGKE